MKSSFKAKIVKNNLPKLIAVFTSLLLSSGELTIFAQDYIDYDHYYEWNDEGIKMEITVKGNVEIKSIENFTVKKSENCLEVGDIDVVSILGGEGEVTAKGVATLGDEPEDLVYMDFTVPVKVKIKGKSSYPYDQELKGCVQLYNLQLEESWTEKVNWNVNTGDPETDAMVKSLLPINLGGNTFKMEQKTLEFNRYPCYVENELILEEEAFMNAGYPMKGKIKYKINLTGCIKIGSALQYDINESVQPYEQYNFPKLHWGPPLETIKWEIVE